MSEVKNLVSDSREDDEKEKVKEKNDKYFDCYLYGAKYYCTQSRANKASIVFDFCQQASAAVQPSKISHTRRRTKFDTAAGIEDMKTTNNNNDNNNIVQGLGGPTEIRTAGSGTKAKIASKQQVISNLRNIPHRDGFISIEGEGDCNGFYVGGQSVEQQEQLKHIFLRIYDKNKRIKLAQDCHRLHWPKMAFSRAFSIPKSYNSIPFFIILVEFLFDNMKPDTPHYNYMSLMESIHCLLLFKNYHKEENRKHDNRHGNNFNNNSGNTDGEFAKCDIALSKKLAKMDREKHDYRATWHEVTWCYLSFLFLFFFSSGVVVQGSSHISFIVLLHFAIIFYCFVFFCFFFWCFWCLLNVRR